MCVYDLMATVVHILDSRTGGSLVAHIKVGETYHQRKEVSEPIQGKNIAGGDGCGAVPGLQPVSCHCQPALYLHRA